MTRRDTLACDSQFSSLGSRYTRFRISLIKALKPQNAMTCGYLCKSVHLTALPMPKTFFSSSCLTSHSCQLVFLCICLFFTSNWPLATTSRGTLRKLNWSVQGAYPQFCEFFLSNGSTESNFRNGSFKMNKFTSQIIFSFSHLVFLSTTM